MDHGFKMHPDGTLEIILPRGKKVGRVLVCEAGTQNGSLYYPEGDVPDINDGDISSSQRHENDLVSRRAAIVQLSHNKTGDDDCDVVIQNDIETIKALPSAEPEIIRCKDCKYYCNVLYSDTQFECGKCCRTFIEDVKPDDFCSRAELRGEEE